MFCGLTYLSSCVDFTSDFWFLNRPTRFFICAVKKEEFLISPKLDLNEKSLRKSSRVVRLMSWQFTTAPKLIYLKYEKRININVIESCWRRNFNEKYLLAHGKNMSVHVTLVNCANVGFRFKNPSAIGKINARFLKLIECEERDLIMQPVERFPVLFQLSASGTVYGSVISQLTNLLSQQSKVPWELSVHYSCFPQKLYGFGLLKTRTFPWQVTRSKRC